MLRTTFPDNVERDLPVAVVLAELVTRAWAIGQIAELAAGGGDVDLGMSPEAGTAVLELVRDIRDAAKHAAGLWEHHAQALRDIHNALVRDNSNADRIKDAVDFLESAYALFTEEQRPDDPEPWSHLPELARHADGEA